VIVLDANILLYAYDATAAQHGTARHWLERVLSGGDPVGLPWQSIGAFLRIVTNPKLPGARFTAEEASRLVDDWLGQPNVRVLAPGENHWRLLRQMINEGQGRGPLVSDAQLAALTIEYGGVLHTTDRDFARFPGLRWTNPLTISPRS
jgi:toxin-antitoxin system PIN domain toxin